MRNFLGVDGGGTKTDFLLIEESGRVLTAVPAEAGARPAPRMTLDGATLFAAGDESPRMGARGLRSERPLLRHLAACKAASFADGSTEMMNERLGRRLFDRARQDSIHGTPDRGD